METKTNYENTYPPMKHTLDSEVVNNIIEKKEKYKKNVKIIQVKKH